MAFNLSTSRTVVIALSVAVIASCAHRAPPQTTMRVCDVSGCTDRPKNYSSFQPANDTTAEDQKIAALEKMAATDPRAAYDLAVRFFRGDGVRQDSYKSIKWMREAAEKGDLEAQKCLGRVYMTGLAEMGPDYGEAQRWLTITAGRGDKNALALLKEATDARKSELAQYQWMNRWRTNFYNNWNSGFAYRWNWNNGAWNPNNNWHSYY